MSSVTKESAPTVERLRELRDICDEEFTQFQPRDVRDIRALIDSAISRQSRPEAGEYKDPRNGRCACEWHGDSLKVMCLTHLQAAREFIADERAGQDSRTPVCGWCLQYLRPAGKNTWECVRCP
jgi:hypothetical protein